MIIVEIPIESYTGKWNLYVPFNDGDLNEQD